MDGGLVFIGMSLGFAVAFRQVQRLGGYIYDRLHPPKPEHAAWASYPREYLVALNELNILIPTDDPDEKDLARYLEETSPSRSPVIVRGAYSQILAPGLSALFGQQQSDRSLNGLNDYQGQMLQQQSQLQNQYHQQGLGQGAPQQNQMLGMVGPNQLFDLLGMNKEKH